MAKTIPVACTLTSAELGAQGERWHRLIARAMTERAETSHGLRICFRPEAEEELRALAAAEAECCPWATWTVERDAGTIVLDVRSTDEGIATLHSVFAPASAWWARENAGEHCIRNATRGHDVDYVKLGSAGMKVSRICLGMMSYGSQAERAWHLDEAAAEPIVKEERVPGNAARLGRGGCRSRPGGGRAC